jgi:hypothetical protein
METSDHIGLSGPTLKRPPKGLRQNLQTMLLGVSGLLPDDALIPTPDGPIPKADLVARLEAGVARFEAVDAQLIALQQARRLLLQEAAALQLAYKDWKDSIAAIVGRRNPVMAQYGLKPEQPRQPLTSEQRLVRATKVRETRRLRHTMGKRQKGAIRYRGSVSVRAELQPMPPTETQPPPTKPTGDGSG